VPLRVIPDLGKVSENGIHPSSKERCDVLHDDVTGSKLANDPVHLVPKTGAFSGESEPLASNADVLTGKTAADEVNFPVAVLWRECANVIMPPNIRPVLLKHSHRVGLAFNLPRTSHASPL
jgi:hypothetical protein